MAFHGEMPPAQDPIDIATATAANGVDTGESRVVNGHSSGKPKNWIPIAEHVLWKPQRKVKMISIGCGFSGKLQARLPTRCTSLTCSRRSDDGPQNPEYVQDG